VAWRRKEVPSSGFRILVVDDQEETLLSTELLLAREGHGVVLASSGREALARHRQEPADLLLIDYFMPQMTGDELIREIRAFDSDVQIILQTGYSGERPPREMLKLLDIQGYHDKSEGPDHLLLWVDVALKAAAQLRRIRTHEQALLDSRAQLRRLSDRLLHLQDEERERVSRELHDQLGQLLTALALNLDWVGPRLGTHPEACQERLHEASGLVRDAIRETRELCATLRPGSLDAGGPLGQALETYASEFAHRAGLELDFMSELAESPSTSTDLARHVYRIAQEALSNVARHADARAVRIDIKRAGEGFTMKIADNGRGFDPAVVADPHAVGLIGMCERALMIDAKLAIESAPGCGTRITLEVPHAA